MIKGIRLIAALRAGVITLFATSSKPRLSLSGYSRPKPKSKTRPKSKSKSKPKTKSKPKPKSTPAHFTKAAAPAIWARAVSGS